MTKLATVSMREKVRSEPYLFGKPFLPVCENDLGPAFLPHRVGLPTMKMPLELSLKCSVRDIHEFAPWRRQAAGTVMTWSLAVLKASMSPHLPGIVSKRIAIF